MLHIPLDSSLPLPEFSSSLVACPNPCAQLQNVIEAIANAKRIVVVCGMKSLNQTDSIFDQNISVGL
jgi:thiamine pyrophosphate-dependent acetolactate synthase large subunit-like protein